MDSGDGETIREPLCAGEVSDSFGHELSGE